MKRKKTSNDLKKHFQLRCLERIGKILKQDELKKMIVNGQLKNIGFSTNNRTNWKIDIDGRAFCIVYDKARHSFVTVIPYDEWIDAKHSIKKCYEYMKVR